MIDASTCILPENTWFVKDMLHSTTHDGHDEFYRILHESEEQITVFDMEEYPQFMQNDTVHQSFYPVTREGTPVEEATSIPRTLSLTIATHRKELRISAGELKISELTNVSLLISTSGS